VTAAAARLEAEADAAMAKGHVGSVRELYLPATIAYATSLHSFYGAPVDPRFLPRFPPPDRRLRPWLGV
jgi:hypothetical protein